MYSQWVPFYSFRVSLPKLKSVFMVEIDFVSSHTLSVQYPSIGPFRAVWSHSK